MSPFMRVKIHFALPVLSNLLTNFNVYLLVPLNKTACRTHMYKYVSYISEQSYILTESEITALLSNSRNNNSQNQVTGILIYFNGIFTQFLEGPKRAVDEVYERILADKRHQKIKELFCGEHHERFYQNWSMAFRSLRNTDIPPILGHKKLDKDTLFDDEKSKTHFGVSMLKNFVEGLHIII